jgi:hypothetical protein
MAALKALHLTIFATSLAVGVISACGRLEAQSVSQQGGLNPRGVIELFTSQGCSSCPPADRLLGKLAQREDLIALTFAVDYWDYLGWKDTLASPIHTSRQRDYARARGDGQVYTPQVVVNGIEHVNGSQEREIEAAIERTRARLKGQRLQIAAWSDDAGLVVETGPAPAGMAEATAIILLALVQRRAEVAIGRGENHGRTITYTNVVRDLKLLGRWTGTARTYRLPKAEIGTVAMDFCTVLVQQGRSGPIIAAVEVR